MRLTIAGNSDLGWSTEMVGGGDFTRFGLTLSSGFGAGSGAVSVTTGGGACIEEDVPRDLFDRRGSGLGEELSLIDSVVALNPKCCK